MENASKALIIAGAILISILLITIGIVLINSGRDVTNSGKSAMSSSAIQAFNSQFTQYEGTNKSYSEVKQLLNAVVSSNASHDNEVVVKLSCSRAAYGINIDTNTFQVYADDGTAYRASGPTIVDISQVKSYINTHSNLKYNVTLHYANAYTTKSTYNTHLNPIGGCIMAVDIKPKI